MSDRAYAKAQSQQKTLIQSTSKSSLLQRKCACGGSPGVDGVCNECRSQRLSLQRRTMNSAEPSLISPLVQDGLHAPGQLLDQATRPFMESRFSHDFSRVAVYGNAPGVIQAKLTMSTPGDRGEQEADRVAEEVMRMPDDEHRGSLEATQRAKNTTLQRLCQDCEVVNRDELQGRGAAPNTEEIDGHVASEIQALHSSGSPLPEPPRAFFEPRFGHDFSVVRIHTDSRAARLARSVHARAFTLGPDIVFGSGEYSPGTSEGNHLLAHELAHVVQQGQTQKHIQRLTVTQHAFTKGTCGERNVQWIFSLDKPATEDGYIVQQVEKYEFVATCPTRAIGPPIPIQKFWEAWFVKKGDKLDWLASKLKYTDSNTRPSRIGTNGSNIATGIIKFFTKSTTGDLGVDGKAPADPKSPWGPGKVPSSADLPSTPSEPAWWSGTAAEGPANRGVWASWDCCDSDKAKHTSNVTAKP